MFFPEFKKPGQISCLNALLAFDLDGNGWGPLFGDDQIDFEFATLGPPKVQE